MGTGLYYKIILFLTYKAPQSYYFEPYLRKLKWGICSSHHLLFVLFLLLFCFVLFCWFFAVRMWCLFCINLQFVAIVIWVVHPETTRRYNDNLPSIRAWQNGNHCYSVYTMVKKESQFPLLASLALKFISGRCNLQGWTKCFLSKGQGFKLQISFHFPFTLMSITHSCTENLFCVSVVNSLRSDFKTQPPVDRRFCPTSGGYHCLEQ